MFLCQKGRQKSVKSFQNADKFGTFGMQERGKERGKEGGMAGAGQGLALINIEASCAPSILTDSILLTMPQVKFMAQPTEMSTTT